MEGRRIGFSEHPFSLACEVEEKMAVKKFTADFGYLADVAFYNSRLLEANDNRLFARKLNMNTLNSRQDKGLSVVKGLMEAIQPTASFTLKPYTVKTVWSEIKSGEPLSDGDTFSCGTAYRATTTFAAQEGFRFVDAEKDQLLKEGEKKSFRLISLKGRGRADSETASDTSDGPAIWAVDGNESTYWHSNYNGDYHVVDFDGDPKYNTYTISLPKRMKVGKFEYVPRMDHTNGRILECSLWYSTEEGDDAAFKPLKEGIIWENTPNKKSVEFSAVEAKQIRIEVTDALSDDEEKDFISAAEFYLYEEVTMEKPVISDVVLGADGKTMTVTANYPPEAVECGYTLERVVFETTAALETGSSYQIEPKLLASDGRYLTEHPGLLGMANNIEYSYQAFAEGGEGETDVISVDKGGRITANKVGKASVRATATAVANGTDSASWNISVQVFEKGTMLLHPKLSYTYPGVGKHPRIASAMLQREDLTPVINIIADQVEGGSELKLMEGAPEPDTRFLNGVTGFNGRYAATEVDRQFNVIGVNPMVISFKFWLGQLPTEDGREYTLISKGNQFNLSMLYVDGKPMLRLQISNDWTQWGIALSQEDTGKWHDIVLIADGKYNENSVGYYMDGVRAPKLTEDKHGNAINAGDGNTAFWRPFAICDKPNETDPMDLPKEFGYLAGLKFYNVNQADPSGELARKINVEALGEANADAAVQSLLDDVTPTAYITITPYTMKTSWSVLNEDGGEMKLTGEDTFLLEDIAKYGYVATTTFETLGDFRFGFNEEELNEASLVEVSPAVSRELIRQNAQIQENGKKLTVRVTFLPAGIPPLPYLTYVSPAAERTVRRQPRYDAVMAEKYFTEQTHWFVNGTGDALSNDYEFKAITKDNWYQAKTVLTAKEGYVFENEAYYTDAVKELLKEKPETFDPKAFGKVGIPAVKKLVMERMKVCGCDGRA